MKLNTMRKPCRRPEKKPGGSYEFVAGCVAQLEIVKLSAAIPKRTKSIR
jgi:hypothetical protein